jgi:CubicO group peptidase (beta-lactamase class C family)
MKIKQVFHLAMPTIVLASLGAISSAQVPVERFEQVVQPYVDARMFMGSVMVAKHGKVLFGKSYGWADAEWSIPNSATTRFQVASMTKQFTAASILLLEERGKLKSDDPVRKYLPDAPASWEKVTIYNLLTMSSGIADGSAKYDPTPPDKLTYADKPLEFQPGEKWVYTNTNYLVLGYLLEKVSGQSYGDFLQQNIFKPLGMNDSGLDSNVAIVPHRASGYWPGADGIENAERTNITGALSAGGVYSSTEDLLRWEEGLFGGKVLTPASFRKMTSPYKHTTFDNDYACALYVNRVNGRLWFDYDGNNIGFTSKMAYYPEEGLAVIVLTNLNSYTTGAINGALAAAAHGESVAFVPPPKEIPLPREVLARYVGTYEFSDGPDVFTLQGAHLMTGNSALFAMSETKFFSKGWDLQYELSRNNKGEYAFVSVYFNGKDKGRGTKK